MELIYSFFSKPKEERAELHFRFSVDKTDYVILSQFPDEAFKAVIEVSDVILDREESTGLETQFAPDKALLGFKWGKSTVDAVIHNTEIDHWESKNEYKISFRNVKGGIPTLCKAFVGDIVRNVSARMTNLRESLPKNDPSCFEEKVSIEY